MSLDEFKGTSMQDFQPQWSAKQILIIEAAAQLIASQGVDAVSMRDIAKSSGNHMSTLYHHFESKNTLYEAVRVWAHLASRRAVISSISQGKSPLDRIRNFSESLAIFFWENDLPGLIIARSLIFTDNIAIPPEASAMMVDTRRRISEQLDALGPALLKKMPSDRLSEIIWDIVWGIVRFQRVHGTLHRKLSERSMRKKVSSEAWLAVSHMLGVAADEDI